MAPSQPAPPPSFPPSQVVCSFAAAVMASAVGNDGFAQVQIECLAEDAGLAHVRFTHEAVCIEWQESGPQFSDMIYSGCHLHAEATSQRLQHTMPCGQHAVARAALQMDELPGQAQLGALLSLTQLGYYLSLAPLAGVATTLMGDESGGCIRLQLARLQFICVFIAWIASAIGASIWAPVMDSPLFWFNNIGAWGDYERVLQPSHGHACSFAGKTSWVQHDLIFPMSLSIILALLFITQSMCDGEKSEFTFLSAKCKRCTREGSNEVGICGDSCRNPASKMRYGDCKHIYDLDLDFDREQLIPFSFWMRCGCFLPMACFHISAIVMGAYAAQSPIVAIAGVLPLSSGVPGRTNVDVAVQYDVSNGLACVSTTSGAPLAYWYASQDCYEAGSPRQLTLRSLANSSIPTTPDLSVTVLPSAALDSQAVSDGMWLQVTLSSVVFGMMLLPVFCNVEEDEAAKFFSCWAFPLVGVLAGASVWAAVSASVALDVMVTLPQRGHLEFLAQPDNGADTPGAQALGAMMAPFGFPLEFGPGTVTGAGSPAMELVQTACGLSVTATLLTLAYCYTILRSTDGEMFWSFVKTVCYIPIVVVRTCAGLPRTCCAALVACSSSVRASCSCATMCRTTAPAEAAGTAAGAAKPADQWPTAPGAVPSVVAGSDSAAKRRCCRCDPCGCCTTGILARCCSSAAEIEVHRAEAGRRRRLAAVRKRAAAAGAGGAHEGRSRFSGGCGQGR